MNTKKIASSHHSVLVAAVLFASAGMAYGESFQLNVVDAGGIPGGSLGNPITWSPSTLAFNPGTGSNFPPSPAAIFANGAVEFDSYIAIDPIGPSTSSTTSSSLEGYQSQGPTNLLNPTGSPTTPFLAGMLTGIWFNTSQSGSFVTSGPENRIFIAQISLRPGTSNPTTAGLMVNIKDVGTVNPDGALGFLKFGIENASNNNGRWSQHYYLKAFSRTITGTNATFDGGKCWDIFVAVAPSPGSGGVILAMGLSVFRRSRRVA